MTVVMTQYLLVFAAILIGLVAADVKCPKLRPDGSSPPCTQCTDCEIPGSDDPTFHMVLLRQVTRSESIPQVFAVGQGTLTPDYDKSPYRAEVLAPKDGTNQTQVTLIVQKGAPKKYRVFNMINSDGSPSYWLSNGNEEGAICRFTTGAAVASFDQDIHVYEWGSVTGCF